MILNSFVQGQDLTNMLKYITGFNFHNVVEDYSLLPETVDFKKFKIRNLQASRYPERG